MYVFSNPHKTFRLVCLCFQFRTRDGLEGICLMTIIMQLRVRVRTHEQFPGVGQHHKVKRQSPPQALRFSHGRGERETSDW